jgi:hypothetical protein
MKINKLILALPKILIFLQIWNPADYRDLQGIRCESSHSLYRLQEV